jgi:hypothetical protein
MLKQNKNIIVTMLISIILILSGCATNGQLTPEGKTALTVGGIVVAAGLIAGAVAMSHVPRHIDMGNIYIGK